MSCGTWNSQDCSEVCGFAAAGSLEFYLGWEPSSRPHMNAASGLPSAVSGMPGTETTTWTLKGGLGSPACRRKVLLIHPDCFNWLIKQLTLNKTTIAAGVLGNKMRITTTGFLSLLTTAFIIIAWYSFKKDIIISYPMVHKEDPFSFLWN